MFFRDMELKAEGRQNENAQDILFKIMLSEEGSLKSFLLRILTLLLNVDRVLLFFSPEL